ncbi:MAG: VCBS repeat-containing protein [Chloracidobacterium sp.]|nr:VCBS repeat-containing protein [Chloracidobacterium sp.]
MIKIRKIFRFGMVAVFFIVFSGGSILGSVVEKHVVLNLTPAAVVFTWNQSATGDWQSPASWTPARTAPASSDVLVFNGGGTTTATNVPNETIGQLMVSGNTIVNFESMSASVLAVSGGVGNDFTVEQNSALNFTGANAIALSLAVNATATINGSITFSSLSTAAHRLTAAEAGAVTFDNGSIFTAGQGFSGNPFGTIALNSVVFAAGSRYVYMAGGDPFGANQPESVVVFKSESLFIFCGNAQSSFFSGRTYANLEVSYPNGDLFATGSNPLVMDDLTLMAGIFHLWMTGTGHSIKGNIFTQPGTRLDMQNGRITLNGKTQQTITRLGLMNVNDGNTIAIDNTAGVIANTTFVAWNLELINGIVTVVDPFWYFGAFGTVVRTNGHVNGYLLRIMTAPDTYTFDVGTENGYAPVIAEVTSGTFPSRLEVYPLQMAQPNIFDPSKSLSRYWTLAEAGDITANLTFHYLDADVPLTANEANFVIQKYNGTAFMQLGGVVDTVANTFQILGVRDFSKDWTLAEPGAVGGTPTVTATPTSTPTSTPTNTPTSTPTETPLGRTAFDYDGDRKADISVFRPTDGAWYSQQSQAGLYGTLFGFGSDRIAPADYDGDGKTDIAVYRPSTGIWYVFNSSNGTVSYNVFGLAEDLPTPADYDGDGKADVSVFRPSTGTWYRQNSSDGSYKGIQFGASEDKPTVGDFDGDGKSDIAVFRPSTGAWYRINSGDGSIYGELFGFGTDVITPADYDGDGKTDLAAYRPTDGIWYLKYSSNSSYDYKVFGLASDIPAPGDFDGDGKADINVFRPSDGTWYRQNSSNGAFIAFQFGANGDKPTMTAFRY